MRNHGFLGGRGTIPDATGTFHELALPILSAGRILDVMTSGGYLGKKHWDICYLPNTHEDHQTLWLNHGDHQTLGLKYRATLHSTHSVVREILKTLLFWTAFMKTQVLWRRDFTRGLSLQDVQWHKHIQLTLISVQIPNQRNDELSFLLAMECFFINAQKII
jgi:hypothetical protein